MTPLSPAQEHCLSEISVKDGWVRFHGHHHGNTIQSLIDRGLLQLKSTPHYALFRRLSGNPDGLVSARLTGKNGE